MFTKFKHAWQDNSIEIELNRFSFKPHLLAAYIKRLLKT